MFAEGDAYERYMGRWSRSLAQRFVEFAGVRNGESYLDVGSGTGALAWSIVEAAPSARVVGIDPSAAFVAHAQSLASNDRVDFRVGGAEALTFPDGVFDGTLSLLAMNFVPNPEKGLREMARVTKPGGVVAAAVWDYGEGMEMLRAFWDEAAPGGPRDEAHMRLCRQGELAALWEDRGLRDVTDVSLTIGQSFASFDDYWSPFLGGQGPAGTLVVSLDELDRAALRDRLRRRLLGDGPDRAFELRARAWVVKGLAPSRPT